MVGNEGDPTPERPEPLARLRLYEALIASTTDLVYAFDRQYRFTFANHALLEMWGRTLEESVGRSLLEVGYEPWHAEMHEREIDQIFATGQPVRGEVGFPHATLGWRIYDYILNPVFDEAGKVEWIAGTTRDITDLKQAQDHLNLMINELNHRVKNTLATIQSIAAQSFRGERADPQARADFESRLIALSDAHTLLTKANWESANLRAVAETALAPFRADDHGNERITIDGDDVVMRPQGALGFAMAFHELASNAVKYGALSNDTGRVSLVWHDGDDKLLLAWRESGGPPVKPPERRGFGSRLIEQGLAREMEGVAQLDFEPSGLVCTIEVPSLRAANRE